MLSHAEDKDKKSGIDEAYFLSLSQAIPIFKDVRAQQSALGSNSFDKFINLFQKLREFEYGSNSDQRYEVLFNIIEMGNFIDAMSLGGSQNELFKAVKDYRNVVSDGFHAYSKDTSDAIILAFIRFLKTFNQDTAITAFKDTYQRIARGENVYQLMVEGGKEQQNQKLVRLLSQMKYFIDKAKYFVDEKKLDAASLSFIGAANCARDLARFYVESEKKRNFYDKFSLAECIELFSSRNVRHIRELLMNCESLINKRTRLFAHQNVQNEKEEAEKYLHSEFLSTFIETFENGLFNSIRDYLAIECQGAQIQRMDDNSPRAYEPEAVRKRTGEKGGKGGGGAQMLHTPDLNRKIDPDVAVQGGREGIESNRGMVDNYNDRTKKDDRSNRKESIKDDRGRGEERREPRRADREKVRGIDGDNRKGSRKDDRGRGQERRDDEPRQLDRDKQRRIDRDEDRGDRRESRIDDRSRGEEQRDDATRRADREKHQRIGRDFRDQRSPTRTDSGIPESDLQERRQRQRERWERARSPDLGRRAPDQGGEEQDTQERHRQEKRGLNRK
jgi:hypothetical protein